MTIAPPPDDEVIHDRRGKPWTVAQLRERVSVVEPGIIRLREIPDSNAEAFTVLAKIVGEKSKDFDVHISIVDLGEATARPDPAMMKAIVDSGALLGDCTIAVRPTSAVIRAILRFVTNRTVGDYVMVDSYDEAVEVARAKLKALQG